MDPREKNALVGVRQIRFEAYPQEAPYDPGVKYSEYGLDVGASANPVYESVRSVLHDLELDADNYGTREWNPLGDIIRPGDKVVIKPNLVIDADPQDAVTTHASVIRPLVDYAWKALKGEGELTICDSPMLEANFERIIARNGLKEMVEILNQRGYKIVLEDARARKTTTLNNVVVAETVDPEKAKHAVEVDLGGMSLYEDNGVKFSKLSDGSYSRTPMAVHHQKGRHVYRIAKRVLDADVVISVPKLKTHKKSGFTCCLKNFVGINVDKNYLPHFTLGPANWGGDEFPRLPAWRIPLLLAYKSARLILLGRLRKYLARPVARCAGVLSRSKAKGGDSHFSARDDAARKVYHLVTGTDYAGSWSGNETIWRMILDLNRVFLFADDRGNLTTEKQRKSIFIVDGFIAGEKDGPLMPRAVKTGIVAAGFNAAMVDRALLELAGIDSDAIPLYREAFSERAGWLHGNEELRIKINGVFSDKIQVSPIMTLAEPDYWKYQRRTQ